MAASKQKLEDIDVSKLLPYVRNARTHSPEQVRQIVASIREFGWTNPVLIDEGQRVIAGHGRLLAARELDMARVPCLRITGLTEQQKVALGLADNKLALNAGWDADLLQGELKALQAFGGDLTITGFTKLELDGLFAPPDATDSGTFTTNPRFLVLVELPTEQQQASFFEEIQGRGLECKVMN